MVFFRPDDELTGIAEDILQTTWDRFPQLAQNQISLTWIVYDTPISNTGGALSAETFWQHSVRGYHYRGVERIYPASVVKIFYMVAVEEWLEKEMIAPSAELDRALRDAIVDSSNDATSLLVDILSGTTSGPELPPGPFETWQFQRNIVNRYYQSLQWPELETINVNQKTWNEGYYGRERAFVGEMMENCNMLTTNAVARLLHAIVGGIAVSSARSQAMMALMKRSLDLTELAANPENQVLGFLGEGLPEAARLWSKSGSMSRVRHDAAYIEMGDRPPYLLVVFTEGKSQSQDEELLPFISRQFVEKEIL